MTRQVNSDHSTSRVFCVECGGNQPVVHKLGAWWCPIHRDRGTVRFVSAEAADELRRLRAENDALRQAARPIVEACETATRISGLTDFREVRLHDTEWKALQAAVASDEERQHG